jgi:hypothetical protein
LAYKFKAPAENKKPEGTELPVNNLSGICPQAGAMIIDDTSENLIVALLS